jgi:hypothetical protein
MTENKSRPTTDLEPAEEQDVEGHSMLLDPNLARDLARSHSKDLDRQVRERKHAKEAKQRS